MSRLFAVVLVGSGATLSGCAFTERETGTSGYRGGAGGMEATAAAGGQQSAAGTGVADAGTAGTTMGMGGTGACPYLGPPPGRVVVPSEPVGATGCTATTADLPDACACHGLSCAPDEACLTVVQFSQYGVGGPDLPYNGCFAVCGGDAECTAPEVCVKNLLGVPVCSLTPCRSADDCTSDQGAICAPIFDAGHAGAFHPAGSQCVYAGACLAESCADCSGEDACHLCP